MTWKTTLSNSKYFSWNPPNPRKNRTQKLHRSSSTKNSPPFSSRLRKNSTFQKLRGLDVQRKSVGETQREAINTNTTVYLSFSNQGHMSRRKSLAASKPTPSTRMCPVEPARFHGKHVEEWNLPRGQNAEKNGKLLPRSKTKVLRNKTWKRTKAKKRTEMWSLFSAF